jgi:hypothetical protein
VGIHKILIHLQVYKGAEQEAYSERLYDVAADSSKNRAKLLETAIELSRGSFYEIQASIFPSGKIRVEVVCSENLFPIWLTDSDRTTKNS